MTIWHLFGIIFRKEKWMTMQIVYTQYDQLQNIIASVKEARNYLSNKSYYETDQTMETISKKRQDLSIIVLLEQYLQLLNHAAAVTPYKNDAIYTYLYSTGNKDMLDFFLADLNKKAEKEKALAEARKKLQEDLKTKEKLFKADQKAYVAKKKKKKVTKKPTKKKVAKKSEPLVSFTSPKTGITYEKPADVSSYYTYDETEIAATEPVFPIFPKKDDDKFSPYYAPPTLYGKFSMPSQAEMDAMKMALEKHDAASEAKAAAELEKVKAAIKIGDKAKEDGAKTAMEQFKKNVEDIKAELGKKKKEAKEKK